ncbi:MAG: hypothetical protein Q8885_01435 [Candidatus Phytoplasma stylosanthis]|nr:hypothetical protein [Candidatus Phytoplasma stylosanthis]
MNNFFLLLQEYFILLIIYLKNIIDQIITYAPVVCKTVFAFGVNQYKNLIAITSVNWTNISHILSNIVTVFNFILTIVYILIICCCLLFSDIIIDFILRIIKTFLWGCKMIFKILTLPFKILFFLTKKILIFIFHYRYRRVKELKEKKGNLKTLLATKNSSLEENNIYELVNKQTEYLKKLENQITEMKKEKQDHKKIETKKRKKVVKKESKKKGIIKQNG